MIYLDHAATSPVLPEVLDAMLPWLGVPANPASVHLAGRQAAAAVERARAHVAALVGGRPEGVVFTSGATEANHAWFHAARARGTRRVAVAGIEHPCVLAAAARCEEVVSIPVGRDGVVRLEGLPAVDGISLMAANHETGAIQPVGSLVGRVAWVHVDASAAAGKLALDLGWADAVTLSAHKLGGPIGVGALVLRDGSELPALLTGGAQERGRRAGTVNTPAVVGFGEAARLALAELDARTARWLRLREAVVKAIGAAGGRVTVDAGLPNLVHGVFAGIPGELLVQALDLRGLCVSAGAACASGSVDDSPVLQAMGEPHAGSGLRISFGAGTTHAEVDVFCRALPEVAAVARRSL